MLNDRQVPRIGHLEFLHDGIHLVILMKVQDVIETDFSTVEIDDTLGQLVNVVSESKRNIFPVLDSKKRFLSRPEPS